MIRSRKGIQLSVNTLVVMILGFIIIAGGTTMVWTLVGEGDDFVAELSGQRKLDLQRMLTNGQLVAVSPAFQQVKAGKDAELAIGIENRLEDTHNFSISHTTQTAEGTFADTNGWTFVYYDSIVLQRNEQQFMPILVRPAKDALNGEYTVIVTVTRETGEIYDTAKFFTLTVE